MTARHLRITGARSADRRAALEAAGPFEFTTTCHRWLRGPCTALTALLHRYVPEAWASGRNWLTSTGPPCSTSSPNWQAASARRRPRW